MVPFVPEAGDPFDREKHQWVKGDAEVSAGASVGQTVAMGLSFQGQQIRRAVVELEGDETPSQSGQDDPVAAGESVQGKAEEARGELPLT